MAEQVELNCKFCRKNFSIPASLYKLSIEKNYPRKFCSRSCSISSHQRLPGKKKILKYQGFIEKLSARILEKRPVTSLVEMSPEKQEKMKRLYENKIV